MKCTSTLRTLVECTLSRAQFVVLVILLRLQYPSEIHGGFDDEENP